MAYQATVTEYTEMHYEQSQVRGFAPRYKIEFS